MGRPLIRFIGMNGNDDTPYRFALMLPENHTTDELRYAHTLITMALDIAERRDEKARWKIRTPGGSA